MTLCKMHIAQGINKICVHLQCCDGITETWWDGSCDSSLVREGYRLFRKEKQRRKRGDAALSVSYQLEHMELCLRMDEQQRVYGSGLRGGQGQVIL